MSVTSRSSRRDLLVGGGHPSATSAPSATRAASVSRSRRRHELLKGNVNAWRHGVFAVVSALPDVATEVALIFASHPGLDLIADRRLVELLATTNVQRQRCLIAMQSEGLTQTLTSYDARLSPLTERLERTVHERSEQRLATHRRNGPDPLARYRAGEVELRG